MKKLVFILIIAVVLTSCSPAVNVENTIKTNTASDVKTPDVVTVTQSGSEITIANKFISRTFSIKNNKIVTTRIVNKRSNVTAVPASSEEFFISCTDGTVKKTSDFELGSWAAIDNKNGSKMLKLVYAESSDGWKVAEYVSMNPNDWFMRKSLDISLASGSKVLDRIDLESAVYPGPLKARNGDDGNMDSYGQPVYANDLFFGVEFPAALNQVSENKLLAGYEYGGKIDTSVYTTKSCVCGAATDSLDVAASFLEYIQTIALPLRWQLQYNTWFDRDAVDSPTIRNSISIMGQNLKKYGLTIADYVIDDHWTDWSNGFWNIRKDRFPRGFAEDYAAAGNQGGGLGLWLSPFGGYSKRDQYVKHLMSIGYENVRAKNGESLFMCMAGANYMRDLKARILELMKQEHISSWKIDGMVWGKFCTNPNHGHPTGRNGYYMSDAVEKWTDLFASMRAQNPDVFISITTGSWNSPWWLQYVNVVWMNDASDMDKMGTGSVRDQYLTYRDARLYDRFITQGQQFPISNLYYHEPVKAYWYGGANEPPEEFRKYMYMCLARGSGFNELYYSAEILTPEEWDVTGEVLNWSRNNFDVLKFSHMIGGNPANGEIYGYSSWMRQKGFVTLRNPSSSFKTFNLILDESIGVKPGSGPFTRKMVYPLLAIDNGPFKYGDEIRVILKPYEVNIYEFDNICDPTMK